MYEYQESDVIFSEQEQESGRGSSNFYIWPAELQRLHCGNMHGGDGNNKKLRGDHSCFSLPICIPEVDHFRRVKKLEDEEEWEGGEVVPPHLIVARRRGAGKMEFSVCSGRGRTLKGRDLKKVRNDILRMTGFLEA